MIRDIADLSPNEQREHAAIAISVWVGSEEWPELVPEPGVTPAADAQIRVREMLRRLRMEAA